MSRVSHAVVLSGRICSGKTTLADGLSEVIGASRLSTRDVLRKLAVGPVDRRTLQELGRELDVRTQGRWLATAFGEATETVTPLPNSAVVVDAVRIAAQLEALRKVATVFHVHLVAPAPVLEERYEELKRRRGTELELPTYSAARDDPTEAQVDTLTALADVVIDTGESDKEQTRRTALRALGDRLER